MSASEQMNALCCFSVVTCKYDGIIDVGNVVARADASVFVFEVDDGYLYVRRVLSIVPEESSRTRTKFDQDSFNLY